MQAVAKTLRLVTDPPGELETLFQTYHERVFKSAHRITGSPADAEDVLQTVFLRLAQSGDTYLSENQEAYMTRAAINASFDLMRRRLRVNSVDLSDEEVLELESEFHNPEVEQGDRELLHLIRQAVPRLGKTAGEMFVLRYYEGYENHEIAKLLNTSHTVVGVVLHRARTRLRTEIGQYLEKHHEKR